MSIYLFNFYAEYIMTNAGLDEAQAGSLLREIPVTSDNADDTTLMAESKEKLKFLLMKMKEG